jgi:hypothetical protein
MILLATLLLCQCQLMTAAGCQKTHFLRLPNHRLESMQVFKVVSNPSDKPGYCDILCVSEENCLSFSHHRELKVCHLSSATLSHDADVGAVPVQDTGWDFYYTSQGT